MAVASFLMRSVLLLWVVGLWLLQPAHAQRKTKLRWAFWHKVSVRMPRIHEDEIYRPDESDPNFLAGMPANSHYRWGGRDWVFLYDYFGQAGQSSAAIFGSLSSSSSDLKQLSGTHQMNGLLNLATLYHHHRHSLTLGPGITGSYCRATPLPGRHYGYTGPLTIRYSDHTLAAAAGVGLLYHYQGPGRFSYSIVNNLPVGAIRQAGRMRTDGFGQPIPGLEGELSRWPHKVVRGMYTRVYLSWVF